MAQDYLRITREIEGGEAMTELEILRKRIDQLTEIVMLLDQIRKKDVRKQREDSKILQELHARINRCEEYFCL